jgi:hypothetical protein
MNAVRLCFILSPPSRLVRPRCPLPKPFAICQGEKTARQSRTDLLGFHPGALHFVFNSHSHRDVTT